MKRLILLAAFPFLVSSCGKKHLTAKKDPAPQAEAAAEEQSTAATSDEIQPHPAAEAPPAAEVQSTPPAPPPKAAASEKPFTEEMRKGYRLLGEARGIDFDIETQQPILELARNKYETFKANAVNPRGVLEAEDARDELKKLEAKLEEERQDAKKLREQSKALLGDDYPANDH